MSKLIGVVDVRYIAIVGTRVLTKKEYANYVDYLEEMMYNAYVNEIEED